jgi:hypothetical protein
MPCPEDLVDQLTAVPVLMQDGPHMRDAEPSAQRQVDLPLGIDEARSYVQPVSFLVCSFSNYCRNNQINARSMRIKEMPQLFATLSCRT